MKLPHAVLPFFLCITAGAGISFGQISIVNAASFDPDSPIAPGSFATVLGQSLCDQPAIGRLDSNGNYPTMLGGCSLSVNGAAAMMQYVATGQINFVVPQNIGSGAANVVISNGARTMTASMMIGPAGPGVFSLNGMGMGFGAMVLGTNWQMGPFSITTNGQPTPVSIFLTGVDLSMPPVVTVGGIAVDVTYYGNAPGYPGLQQINVTLPANMAGIGRVPVTVTSNGQTSNVTFMSILPTTAMMQGVPGWGAGMMVGEDMPRSVEMSAMAVNPANNTVIMTDEAGDALRVISLSSKATLAVIALPSGSESGSVAVNASGTLAAVALPEKGSVALIDLTQNQANTVIATGYYACRLAFTGNNLLVTNGKDGTMAAIDVNSRQVVRTVNVGFGPSGIAVSGNTAVVANMQAGSISLINLTDYSVSTVSLPGGSRPHEVAISGNTAIITNPMWNNAFILNLTTQQIKTMDLTPWSGMGPGAVAVNGSMAYVADQMTASVAVIDLNAGSVVKTFPVDPGPRSLAVNGNQILVLCQGTGTLDVVDSASYTVTDRINVTSGSPAGRWTLPLISSISPNSAHAGTSFTLTISGTNLQGITAMEFLLAGSGMGGGMMSGGPAAGVDPNIQVSNISVNSAGNQLTAAVQIEAAATPGTRRIRMEANQIGMMGPMNSTLFTVAQ